MTVYWTVNTAFDPLGRVTLVTRPYKAGLDSTVASFYQGLTTSVTEHVVRAGGSTQDQTTTSVRNARGLVVAVTDARGKTSSYTYDSEDDVLTVSDSGGKPDEQFVRPSGQQIRVARSGHGGLELCDGRVRPICTGRWTRRPRRYTLSYDGVGRAVQRGEADTTSYWTFGSTAANHDVGKLVRSCSGTCAGNDYVRVQAYDGAGRPQTVTLTIGGTPQTLHPGLRCRHRRVATLQYRRG